MEHRVKLIIMGFALMFMGATELILSAIIKSNKSASVFQVILAYGFYAGLILIVIGLISNPDNDKNK